MVSIQQTAVKMSAVSLANIALLIILLNGASSTLLCYDCDAGRDCENPELYNVRIVNCEKQYPDALKNNDKLVCLALDISLPGTGPRGFNLYKSGIYRGCRVIPKDETNFCDNLKTSYADRLTINSCKYCTSTRCIP